MAEHKAFAALERIRDLFFNDQWPFHKMNNHADINIEEGWKTYLSATDNSNNGKEVIIAVIDIFNHIIVFSYLHYFAR